MGQFVQIVVAIAIGCAILAAGWWAVRLLATPGPGDPDPGDIVAVNQEYGCTVCGMRLTVTLAQGEDVAAPRHCREPMEPVAD